MKAISENATAPTSLNGGVYRYLSIMRIEDTHDYEP